MSAASTFLLIAALSSSSAPATSMRPPAPPKLLPLPAAMTLASGAYTIPFDIGVSVPKGDAAAAFDARWLADELGRLSGPKLHRTSGKAGVTFTRIQPDTTLGEEGYRLDVDGQGLHISAPTDAGLMHGAATALQVLTPTDSSRAAPYLHIDDAPRLRWRGLMLDSVRHIQSLAFIERFIDQMARYKLNTFHWHLTDDQGWRIEIKKYPRLTQVGAWRVDAGVPHQLDIDPKSHQPRRYGGFYTQAQIRKLVAFARARGITIVPEIEMPGHASAAIYAMPELGLRPVRFESLGDWGVFPNLYNPNERTEAFLEDVLTEVMNLFPSDYIHVGGDEAVKDYWKASPEVQTKIKTLGLKDEDELQSWFINRIGRFLDAHGRKMIGWDEILQGGLPQGAAVMSWHGVSGGMEAARLGHDAVLTPGLPFYFDNRVSPALDEPPGRGLVITLRSVYAYDPTPPTLEPGVREHILGVQANLWAEHIRLDERIEHMAFPRAAAVAEMGWSPQAARQWDDFLMRLGPSMHRDEKMGLTPAESALDPHDTPPIDPRARDNHQLLMCTTKGSLNLEAPGPVSSKHRATYLVDINNPCWQWKDADLAGVTRIKVSAGLLPWNFQIGADAAKIPLRPQSTANGELVVHLDGCDGEIVATLTMPKVGADPTGLASGPLKPQSGRHDLCFLFSRPQLDPWWALGSVELEP